MYGTRAWDDCDEVDFTLDRRDEQLRDETREPSQQVGNVRVLWTFSSLSGPCDPRSTQPRIRVRGRPFRSCALNGLIRLPPRLLVRRASTARMPTLTSKLTKKQALSEAETVASRFNGQQAVSVRLADFQGMFSKTMVVTL